MQSSLNFRSPGLVVLVASVTTLTSFGCRSTRSSFSQLPGMSWAAPADEELYGGWSEDGDPKLPAPSQVATPQLTSKSNGSELKGTTRTPEKDLRATRPSGSSISRSSTEYPDTGYPALQQPKTLATDESADSSRDLSGSPTSAPQRRPIGAEAAPRTQSQRGFYGDTYTDSQGDEYAEPAASSGELPQPSRYSDAGPPNSRFSDSETSAPERSRYSGGEDVTVGSPSTADSQPLVSDSDSGYDPRGAVSGQVADESAVPYDEISDGIRQDYRNTTDELRTRLNEQAESVSNRTRELSNNVQGMARQAGEQIEQGAKELGREVRDGYSRFSNQWSDSDPADATGSGGTPVGIAADSRPAPELSPYGETSTLTTPSGAAVESSTSRGPEQTRASRTNQPWRPGSTGTFPAGDVDQTHYPPPASYRDVEPASYPESGGSESRLTPSYR